MGIKILDMFLPRELEFYKHFNHQAEIFTNAIQTFHNLVKNFSKLSETERKKLSAKIKEYETEGDAIEFLILQKLEETFITPLDREDIHELVTSMDNCLDEVCMLTTKVRIYKLKKMPKDMDTFADIMLSMAKDLQKLVQGLEKRKSIPEYIKKIHEQEHEADKLFHNCIARLFDKGTDPVDIIRYKNIYEGVEYAINSIERVSKVVRGIVLKQG